MFNKQSCTSDLAPGAASGETLAWVYAYWRRLCLADYEQTLHLPQNRKYTMCCDVVRGQRHTDTLIARLRILIRGRSNYYSGHRPGQRLICAYRAHAAACWTLKAKFHYASGFEAGSKQVRSWSQTCSKLKFGLSSTLLAAN